MKTLLALLIAGAIALWAFHGGPQIERAQDTESAAAEENPEPAAPAAKAARRGEPPAPAARPEQAGRQLWAGDDGRLVESQSGRMPVQADPETIRPLTSSPGRTWTYMPGLRRWVEHDASTSASVSLGLNAASPYRLLERESGLSEEIRKEWGWPKSDSPLSRKPQPQRNGALQTNGLR